MITEPFLAMDVCSCSTISAFSRHVKICYYVIFKINIRVFLPMLCYLRCSITRSTLHPSLSTLLTFFRNLSNSTYPLRFDSKKSHINIINFDTHMTTLWVDTQKTNCRFSWQQNFRTALPSRSCNVDSNHSEARRNKTSSHKLMARLVIIISSMLIFTGNELGTVTVACTRFIWVGPRTSGRLL
jgi:hypothetical protein